MPSLFSTRWNMSRTEWIRISSVTDANAQKSIFPTLNHKSKEMLTFWHVVFPPIHLKIDLPCELPLCLNISHTNCFRKLSCAPTEKPKPKYLQIWLKSSISKCDCYKSNFKSFNCKTNTNYLFIKIICTLKNTYLPPIWCGSPDAVCLL